MRRIMLGVPAVVAAAAGMAWGQACAWPVRFEPTGAAAQGQVRVGAAVVFDDDGAGPRGPGLYISGYFDRVGGVAAARLARWMGAGWEAVGTGFTGGGDLAVFDDDGAGPHGAALYAIGAAGTAGAIGKWDGQQWTTVATGWPLFVNAYPDLGGPSRLFVLPENGTGALKLHVGCAVSHVSPGGVWVEGRFFRLDAGGWTHVTGAGVIDAAAVFDPDGAGPVAPAIYLAHTSYSDYPFPGTSWDTELSRLDGSTLTRLAITQSVEQRARYMSMAVFDDDGAGPGAPALYVGGEYALQAGLPIGPHLSRWDGAMLVPIAGDADGAVSRLQVFSSDPVNPGQSGLYALGDFRSLGGIAANGIARRGTGAWSTFGPGFEGALPGNGPAQLAAMDDDGAGPRPTFVYAVGAFTSAGYDPAAGVARWDGHYWEPPGKFLNNAVHAMVVAEGGAGLYLGGGFTSADGIVAVGVARWDGAAFSRLGTGMNNHVDALAVFQGSVFAGGKFTFAGGGPASRVARWTGSAWAAVGNGLIQDVRALAAYDDGSGPALFAGGDLSLVFQGAARWDGQQWAQAGTGMNGAVNALCVHGGSLYAAGLFNLAANQPAEGLARWEGGDWRGLTGVPVKPITAMASHGGTLYIAGASTDGASVHALHGSSWFTLPAVGVSPGMTSVSALCSRDEDGAGPAPAVLCASVETSDAGSPPEYRLMRWDGREWSVVSEGLDGGVRAFAGFGAGTLYAGGAFQRVGGETSWFLAGLGECPARCYANCDESTAAPVLNINDFQCFVNQFAAGMARANCDRSTAAPALNVLDFVCFLNEFAAGCE